MAIRQPYKYRCVMLSNELIRMRDMIEEEEKDNINEEIKEGALKWLSEMDKHFEVLEEFFVEQSKIDEMKEKVKEHFPNIKGEMKK